jgi:hypothetical protein
MVVPRPRRALPGAPHLRLLRQRRPAARRGRDQRQRRVARVLVRLVRLVPLHLLVTQLPHDAVALLRAHTYQGTSGRLWDRRNRSGGRRAKGNLFQWPDGVKFPGVYGSKGRSRSCARTHACRASARACVRVHAFACVLRAFCVHMRVCGGWVGDAQHRPPRPAPARPTQPRAPCCRTGTPTRARARSGRASAGPTPPPPPPRPRPRPAARRPLGWTPRARATAPRRTARRSRPPGAHACAGRRRPRAAPAAQARVGRAGLQGFRVSRF